MIADSYMVPEGHVCPRSFGGLMALYESNYIKLQQLLGDTLQSQSRAVSRAPDDMPVFLSRESTDKARYTQDIRLTYLFEEAGDVIADPDLCVRIYLDARMAEVRSWASHHRHNVLLQLRRCYGRELDRRWARNMMLGKWLDYLLERGYSFSRLTDHQALAAVL